MSKYVVGARHDENGNISGGKAGDQTGQEVCVHLLSSAGEFTKILRAPYGQATMVKQAYAVAYNDNVGYSQDDRYSLYTQALACAWELARISVACNCDCSSLIAVLCILAGFSVSKYIYTGNEISALVACGFECLDYNENALKVGDILWRDGHTVIYVGTSETCTEDTLEIDGYWGECTTKALQKFLKTGEQDGQIYGQAESNKFRHQGMSNWHYSDNPPEIGSETIFSLQTHLKNIGYGNDLAIDGHCGKYTINAIQSWFDVGNDGIFSCPSETVRRLQMFLNENI